MAVGDTYRLSLVGDAHAAVIITTYHYRQTIAQGGFLNDENALAVIFGQTIVPKIKDVLSVDVTLANMSVMRVHPTGGAVVDTALVPGPGTRPGPALPNTVAMVISKRTGQPGRARRGRWYFGNLSEDDTIANVLLPIFETTQVAALRSQLLLTISAAFPFLGSFEPVHYSRKLHAAGQPPVFPIVSTPLNPVLGNQRRRRPGVGV